MGRSNSDDTPLKFTFKIGKVRVKVRVLVKVKGRDVQGSRIALTLFRQVMLTKASYTVPLIIPPPISFYPTEMPLHNMDPPRSRWEQGLRPPWVARLAGGQSPASSGVESDTESSSTESERVRRSGSHVN